MTLSFTADPEVETTTIIRSLAGTFLKSFLPKEATENIILALSEASTNCVLHAKSKYTTEIDFRYGEVRLCIADNSGRFFNGNVYQPPLPGTVEGKMGILTIKSLMDDAVWIDNGSGTTVEMHKKVGQTVSETHSLSKQAIGFSPSFA